MPSPRLAVLLLALQIGSVVSFAPSPLDPQANALKQSTAAIGIEWDAPAEIAKQEPRFEQNTKLMYDDILDNMPWFIRKLVEKNMNNAIAELCEEAVTENDMYAIIVKITPKSNLQDSIDILDRHKTHAANQPVANAASITFLIAGIDRYFEQSSKLMYDSMLEATPGFIRKVVEKNMNNAIAELCEGAVVTELDMYEVVKQITPKHFLQNSLNVLDQHKTHAVEHFEEDHPTSFFMVADKEVCFKANSRIMYEKVIEDHPSFVRQVVKNNLDKAISEMCGEVMTEEDMYDVIISASPKPLLKFNLIVLDEHKTS